MKNKNGIYIIGVDHGYGNIKTANCCFPTGVESSDTEPTFKNDLLIYQGRYYQIGVGHKEYAAEKVMDEDYYILTQFCIAKELSKDNVTEAIVRREIGGYEGKIVAKERTVSQKSENIRTNDIIEKEKNGNIMPDPDKEEIINSIDSSFMSTFSTKLNIGTED